jgi:opacity protein-like surface antigen
MSDLSAKPTSSLGTDVTMGLSYGVGVEMAISDRWSGRLEANIHDFGEPTRSFNGVSQGVKSELRVISLGLTRKF